MRAELKAKQELDIIFEEYINGTSRGKYKRYARAIAILMEYDDPGSFKRFLGKYDAKKGGGVGNGVGLQFYKKILSVHSTGQQKTVMDYFHSIKLDYDPKDILTIAETYRALAERDVEKLYSYPGITATSNLRTGLYSALKAAKINTLIDVLGFGSDPLIEVLEIRNLGPKKYKILMSIVEVFAPKNEYAISTGEIELFKKILGMPERDKSRRE